jgi:hypothetical protein
MFDIAAERPTGRAAVAQQRRQLAHVVVGRVVPLLVLEGRAWDTGLENFWCTWTSRRNRLGRRR